jgi:hypothetical protein
MGTDEITWLQASVKFKTKFINKTRFRAHLYALSKGDAFN